MDNSPPSAARPAQSAVTPRPIRLSPQAARSGVTVLYAQRALLILAVITAALRLRAQRRTPSRRVSPSPRILAED